MKTFGALLILSASISVSIHSAIAQSSGGEPPKPVVESEGVYQPPELRGIGHSGTTKEGSAVVLDKLPKNDVGDIGNVGDMKTDPTPAKALLSGAANAGVSINIETASAPQDHGLFGIRFRVVNDTKEPLIFDGDNVTVAGSGVVSSPMPQMDTTGFPPCVRKGNLKPILESALTIGAIPTLKDMKIASGPKLARYGCDELRRETEVARLGKRVVWPGASSNGIVYFKTHPPKGSTVQMPVSALFDSTDKTVVTTVVR